mmetsp:Transcript_691/g.1432  ORF Transcript_691/g.1432 Transcript_691/m.1432 type:complete len:314 (-) Transcript_691:3400-4341(-)
MSRGAFVTIINTILWSLVSASPRQDAFVYRHIVPPGSSVDLSQPRQQIREDYSLITPQIRSRRNASYSSRKMTSLFAIPDVSSLSDNIDATPIMNSPSSLSFSSSPILLSITSASLTYLSLLLLYDRPRGHLSLPSLPSPDTPFLISQSRIPNAGLGLFVTRSLPEGTVLGSYPGVLRPAEAFYNGKCRRYPQAVAYSWRFTDNKFVIDPTNENGEIQSFCYGGSDEVPFSNLVFRSVFSFWRKDTALARINEPPIGIGGCNVRSREDLEKREIVFELCRDVVGGEELFMDYGVGYDRSGYGPTSTTATMVNK